MLKCIVLVVIFLCLPTQGVRYEPTWESIDSRPIPEWYDEAKLGIFVHWGVFSVPSFFSEWFWYWWQGPNPSPQIVEFMKKNYPPDFNYADFAKDFTAEFFDPDQWARLFAKSGAKYIVFVSKHTEGFSNWPSKYTYNWNSVAVGPNRNIVADLAAAVRANTTLRFGLYHCLYEWFNPLYLQDKANNFTTNEFIRFKTNQELYELVNLFEPDIVWSDGDWETTSDYWNSTHFLAWLYNDSPVKDHVVTNDRWGIDADCHHGGFLTCKDRYNPGVLQPRKFENAMTIDKQSWGFRRNALLEDYLTIQEILHTFIITVSTGGNMLMNVGPTKYGIINPIFEERLTQMGEWLNVNGEGIYASKPWKFQNDTLNPDVWYTMKPAATGATTVYAFLFNWPTENVVTLKGPWPEAEATVVTMLGRPQWDDLDYTYSNNIMNITLPSLPVSSLPCQWVWTLRLTNINN